MFTLSSSGQFEAKMSNFAFANFAASRASLTPSATFPVLTAICICLFTSIFDVCNSSATAFLLRHGHVDFYKSSAHGYLLANDNVLSYASQSVSDSFYCSIHDCWNCNFEGCFRQGACFLSTHSVSTDL